MRTKVDTSCKDCEDRQVGCHDAAACEKWAKYEAKKRAAEKSDAAKRKAIDDFALVRAGAKKKLEHNRVVSLKKKR